MKSTSHFQKQTEVNHISAIIILVALSQSTTGLHWSN